MKEVSAGWTFCKVTWADTAGATSTLTRHLEWKRDREVSYVGPALLLKTPHFYATEHWGYVTDPPREREWKMPIKSQSSP